MLFNPMQPTAQERVWRYNLQMLPSHRSSKMVLPRLLEITSGLVTSSSTVDGSVTTAMELTGYLAVKVL